MEKQGKMHYAWWIMIASAAIYAASVGIIVSCAGILYRAVAADFEVGVAQISLYSSIMYLTITFFLPFAGKLLKKIDVRYLLTIAGIMNALAFGLMSTYTAPWQFYISGFVLGLGSTILIYGTIPLLINNWFKVKAGTALGTAMAFMGIGGVIFTQIAGNLVQNLGWRPTYVILAICVAILILPFSIFVIRSKPEDMNKKPYGADQVSKEGTKLSDDDDKGLMKGQALKTVPFYFILVFVGLFGLSSTVGFHVPNYAQSIGFNAIMAATGVTFVTVGQTGGKFLLGWINDKFGISAGLITGIGGGMIGIVGLMVSDNFGTWMLYLAAFLFGIGFSGSTLLPPPVIRKVFGGKDYAAIYTTIMSASTLGVAFGTTLFSYIYDTTGSYYAVFIIVLIMFAITLLSALYSLTWRKKFNF